MRLEYVFGFIALFVIVFTTILYLYLNRKGKTEEETDLRNISSKTSFPIRVYDTLDDLAYTRRYLRRISGGYETIYPENKKIIAIKTIKTMFTIAIISLIAIILLIFIKPGLFMTASSLLVIYVVNTEVSINFYKNTKKKMLTQFEKLITETRHNYYAKRNITEALWLSMDNMQDEIKSHAKKIYDVLNADDIKDEVIKYNETVNNRHLKIFLAQCVAVSEKGDTYENDSSVFINKLIKLKENINAELNHMKKTTYLFSGISLACVVPVFTLPMIKSWALSNIPELASFYNGKLGIITSVIAFLISILFYNATNALKEMGEITPKKYRLLTALSNKPLISKYVDIYLDKDGVRTDNQELFLKKMGESMTPRVLFVKRVLYCITSGLICLITILTIHGVSKKNLLYDTTNAEAIAVTATIEQVQLIKENILFYMAEFKEGKELTSDFIKEDLLSKTAFRNNIIVDATATEVMLRIENYKNEYMKWYEFLIALLVACIGYWYPYLALLMKKGIIQDRMQEEVMQFQDIIYMNMNLPGINTISLLEECEVYSNVFKKSIQECIVEMSEDEEKALKNLRKKEPYIPFQHLVDCFGMIDSNGVITAFDEISTDIKSFSELRKLESNIALDRRVRTASFLSFVPAVFILTFYLILPFLIYSLLMLNQYSSSVNQSYYQK